MFCHSFFSFPEKQMTAFSFHSLKWCWRDSDLQINLRVGETNPLLSVEWKEIMTGFITASYPVLCGGRESAEENWVWRLLAKIHKGPKKVAICSLLGFTKLRVTKQSYRPTIQRTATETQTKNPKFPSKEGKKVRKTN